MERTNELISSVILIGGESSRFQAPKHLATYHGQTFLEIISLALSPLVVKYSVHNFEPDLDPRSQIIDGPNRIGPIGGIFQSLSQSQTTFTLITSCDLPLLTNQLVTAICGQAMIHNKTVIATIDSNLVPTFGVYKSSDYKYFEQAIANDDFKLMNVVANIDYVCYELPKDLVSNLTNVNTQSQLAALSKPFIFTVSGYKNSGKTTLVSKLLTRYLADGQKVAVLKHDGHDFTVSNGTDSGKFINIGSNLTTVYSETKHQTTILEEFNLNSWLATVSDYDIVIVEGLKDSDYPKVVIEDEHKLAATNRIITVNHQTRNDLETIYRQLRKAQHERF